MRNCELALLTQADLDTAVHSLDGGPRPTLGWMTPSENLAEALQCPSRHCSASGRKRAESAALQLGRASAARSTGFR